MAEPTELPPRLLAREEAAAYVGLSPNSFDHEVSAGTFTSPFPLTNTRRRLWDVRALDAAMDRAMGIRTVKDDMEARERAYRKRKKNRAQAVG